jgi:hypothetical protein
MASAVASRVRPRTLQLHFHLVARPEGHSSRTLGRLVYEQVSNAQAVLHANESEDLPRLSITARSTEIKWRDYRPLLSSGLLPSLIVEKAGRDLWNADPAEDIFPICESLATLLTINRQTGWLPIYVVPALRTYVNGWRLARAIAIGTNDFPVTTARPGSGPAILMSEGEPNDTVLIHELGHVLIDWPRNVNGGNEHVLDSDRVCYQTSERVGNRFSREELVEIARTTSRFAGT